ncbi:MAG: hypothetical protein AB8B74_04570 [Crocinitomicaceae bacterium]
MKNLKTYLIIGIALFAFTSCEKEVVTPTAQAPINVTKNASVNSTGVGGSLAQFTIVGDYLYTLDFKSVKVFDIKNSEVPQLVNTVNLGYGIETIYSLEETIFIGTTNGVKILSATDPVNIVEMSEFEHVTACDPVIANSNHAFSTVRGGTPCGGSVNQLNIIDISTITNPELRSSIELINPYGLGFSNEDATVMYVCDGYDGLKGYDISDIENTIETMHYTEINARDVISTDNDLLIVLGLDAIYQFDNSNPFDLVLKSEISIQ